MTNEKNDCLETGNSTHFPPERLVFIAKIMSTLKDSFYETNLHIAFSECHSDTTLMKMLMTVEIFVGRMGTKKNKKDYKR